MTHVAGSGNVSRAKDAKIVERAQLPLKQIKRIFGLAAIGFVLLWLRYGSPLVHPLNWITDKIF